jgi:ABC-type uncharacterized transport system substrate-binding protein
MQWSNRLLKLIVFSFTLLWLSVSVHAHPHNWIFLNSSFVLDDNARLVQVKQAWEFDMYYSLMTHADLLNEFGEEMTGLKATADSMIRNLKDYEYFSKLSLDGSKIDLGVPKAYKLYTKEKEGQMVLELEMTFDMASALDIENKTLAWQVFDPTYFIAMNHATENNIEIIGGNATECSKELKFPEPSDELIDYAQSLDRTQKNTDGLGASFAETAFINCI